MANKKIETWKSEIEKIKKSQADMIEKNNKKIKELQSKISFEEEKIEKENNKLVADIVRATYGEINEDTLVQFKEFMKTMNSSNTNSTARL